MAQNNLSIIGAGGVKNLVSLGDFDQWLDQRVNDRFNGGGDIAKFYQAVPWLFRGTMLRAQAIASFPFDIVRDGSTTPIDPDDYANELDFIPDLTTKLWQIEASLTLTGKGYLRNLRNRIVIKEVRYYAPTTITPKYDKQTGELIGYTRKANGKTYELTPEEITAFWYPDPFAEIGEPTHYPAQAARAASGVMFNLDLFAELFFGRGAVKASIISAKANTQPTERARLKEWFQSFFTGIQNAHNVEVINADAVTVTQIGEGVKELENTDLSQTKREDIAAALSIPQTMLFSGSAAGLGGGGVTDADDIRFVNEFKIPEITFIANILNRGTLVPNGFRMIPMPERLDALHEDEAALASTATSYADLLDKCADYETWEALADMTGFEYDETKIKKVFALKESRRVEQQTAEAARLEAQRAQMGQGGYQVSRPDVPQLTAGDNAKAIGGGNVRLVTAIGDDSAMAISVDGSAGGNHLASGFVVADTKEDSRDLGSASGDFQSGREIITAAKALERKQYRTWAAKASNAGKVFRFAYLNEDEQFDLTGNLKAFSSVKSIGSVANRFEQELTRLVNDAWANQQGKITADMRALVKQYVEDAFDEGMLDGDSTPDKMSDADKDLVNSLALDQIQYIAKFATDVAAAATDSAQQESIRRRIKLWAESIYSIGQRGWVIAKQKVKRRIQVHTASDELVCPICGPLNDKIVEAGKPITTVNGVPLYNEPFHPHCRCSTTDYVQPEDFA